MSSDDRDIPDFDDLDLPDEMVQPSDQTDQPTDAMSGPTEEMVSPDEDTVEPIEGTAPSGFAPGEAPAEEFTGPLPGEAEGEQPDESQGESDEEVGGEEEEKGREKDKKKKKKKKKKEKKEAEKTDGFVQKVLGASPYTVMLGVSLAAILMAILCLFFELKTYNLDIKAKEAKQRVGAAPPVQLGPPSTTAAV